MSPLPVTRLPSHREMNLDRREFLSQLTAFGGAAALANGLAQAEDSASPTPAKEKSAKAARDVTAETPKSKEPVPLNKQQTVLLDLPGKRLLLKAKVCLRDGLLEMLCCLKQTKEHESILSIESEAYVIHTGLLALGAKPGAPVKFQPEYSPPTGTRLRIFLQWTDANGKQHREPAERWIRNSSRRFFVELFDAKPEGLVVQEGWDLKWDEQHKELYWYGHMTPKQRDQFLALSKNDKYQKAIKKFFDQTQPQQLNAPWVFTGSGFYQDEGSKTKSYLAEGGDLICVANFPSAMIDIAIKSSAEGESNLLWETWTDRIPPVGTEVLIELLPDLEEKPTPKKSAKTPETP